MEPSTPSPKFSTIKNRVPVDVALTHYGVTLKQQASRLVGRCPIHGGSNDRGFVVSPDRRSWYCFGDCSRGGSVLDLVMELEEASLTEAAAILVQRYHIEA